MIVQIIGMLIYLGICLFTDRKEQKIKNKYSLPFAVIGLVVNGVTGPVGLLGSLLGLVLPFFVFFLFFYLRMFRAGDIKAMMVVGAWMGYRFIGNAIFYIFAIGLLLAVGKMIYYHNSKERFAKVGNYFKLMFLSFRFAPYEVTDMYDKTAHFPFSIAIAGGCIANLLASYMGFYIFFAR